MSAVNWPHEQNMCDLHDCIFSAETVLLFTREATMHYFQCDWGGAALNGRLAAARGQSMTELSWCLNETI